MESKRKVQGVALLVLLLSLAGCATGVSHRDIVLTDSEVPWRMTPGVYQTSSGEERPVTPEAPRWSVSEAWLFERFSELGQEKPSLIQRYRAPFIGSLVAVLTYVALLALLRKRSKSYV
jgi:hypothetical protein